MLYLFMMSALFMGQAQEPNPQQKANTLLESLVETYPGEFQRDAVKFLKSRLDLPAIAAELKKQGEVDYEISCKNKKGYLWFKFDENGEIVKAIQTFKNIPLPQAIVAYIPENYKGWEVTQTVFNRISKKDRHDKQRYVITLKKDRKKKTLKIKPALNKGLSKI